MIWSRSVTAAVGTCTASLVLSLAPVRPAAAAVTYTEPRQLDGRSWEFQISSPSIANVTKTVRLYVPDGWRKEKDAPGTWPTLWMLHGGGDDHNSWDAPDKGKGRLKEMVKDKQVIVVIPETDYCSSYSNWKNNAPGKPPQWDTFLVNELDQVLRSRFHANDKRAVAGISMGGLGSFGLPQRYPGFFKAAASYSGNLNPMHLNPVTKEPTGGYGARGVGCSPFGPWPWAWDGEYGNVNVWGNPKDKTDPDASGPLLSGFDYWKKHTPVAWPHKLAGIPLYMAVGSGSDVVEEVARPESEAMRTSLQNAGITPTYKVTNSLPRPAGWDACTGGHNFQCWNLAMLDSLDLLVNAVK